MGKITREKFKTYGNVFDQFTEKNLFKLSTQGHFDELESSISIGKEANIFSARKKDNSLVIVKIYRLENCDFNKMFDYIKYDPRYDSIKKRRREIIFNWTQREYRNLLKAREHNIRVPTVHTCMYNIIVMDFIGNMSTTQIAHQIKDSLPENRKKFGKEIIRMMGKLLKAGLVHGDLSEFNILNDNGKPVFIDFSQSTPKESQNAQELLKRDCKNISKFLTKYCFKINKEELYETITTTKTDKE